jgi:2-polyprenyl-6-methoxyphenol hydroxylase-like FAD-dependent oxidoreductase
MSPNPPRVRVLVVGAGPVGLALAGDLGWRGIDCLLIEQSDGAIYQPRMDLVGIRTMEHCRRWGIVKDVENSPYPRDYPQDNVYLTSLGGYELGREQFPPLGEEKPPPQSPQKRERCPQNLFDPILRAFAERQKTVALRYLTKLTELRFDDGGVVATVRDQRTGEEREFGADFVAGCDGAHSTVRQLLGIGMHGNPALTYTTNIIFRCADLAARHPGRKPYRYIFIGPEGTWATIVAINGGDQWRMSIIGGETPRDLSIDDIHAAIRRAIGSLLPYEILSVVPWIRKELVAESYRKGPAFILGDAAHVMSPTGAYGMNTGIGDAVDLSWKLAAAIGGWGGEALLGSFDAERRPIAVRNVREASGNLRRMLSPGRNEKLVDDTETGAALRRRVGAAMTEAMRQEWFTLGMHLGYRYEDSPVCIPDGTPPTPDDTRHYAATTRPGSRAPHVWLPDGRSTLDLFGKGFVLLRLGARAPDVAPLVQAARQQRMPLEVVSIDEATVASAYEQHLVLVRPDGHVAWRGDDLADPSMIINTVCGVSERADLTATSRAPSHQVAQVRRDAGRV